MINFKEELNNEQFEAVTKGDGPVLVLAGAGSGKTRTLTYRVAYLVEQGVDPENILLVTFTNKASSEMLERVEKILNRYPRGIWGGTFHRIGNRLLRKYATLLGYKNNFTILDREDSMVLLKQCYDELANKNEKSNYFPKAKIIHNLIGFARNRGMDLRDLMGKSYDYLSSQEIDLAQSISEYYARKKKDSNAMDFDDLLINWLKLLTGHSKVREKFQEQFKYILVDEYQDTNVIQDKIINILAVKNKNILVVGDDSQSIYSFRAAEISNILDFSQNFSKTKIHKLETNYRSTPEILELANQSILNNENKYPKNLKSIKSENKKPLFVVGRDNREQAKFISQEISRLIDQGESPQEIAVLFRSAFQALELELELNREGIPYTMRGGIKFFEQKHIKDIVSYLKVLSNFKDETAWRRVLMLHEGIGLQTAGKIFSQIKNFNILEDAIKLLEFKGSEKINNSLKNVLSIFKELVEIKEDVIQSSVKIILKNGYNLYLKTNFENFLERADDLNQMGAFSENYKSVDDFLSEVALTEAFKNNRNQSNVVQVEDGEKDKIILSTIHQAKGLEWNTVFVIGLVDGQFPHRKVYEKHSEIEEERRLFYVAVTRAKDKLYLTYPMVSSRSEDMNEVSTFIEELDESLFEKKGRNEESFDDLPVIEYE
ncbi:ATP-dependent helicase [Candidatus Falkowbacteria bacterium]|nr:ATP-dependent helicase [Candidatus Falkowbacteria bacterium]